MYSKKLPAGVRIVLGFISVLLSIVLFFSVAAAILIGDVRVVTSKDGLQTIISQALFESPRLTLRPAPLASGVIARPSDTTTIGATESALVDTFYDVLKQQFGDELPVSKDALSEFVNNSSLPDFMSEKVAGIINDIYTGESTTTITKDEVVGLLRENKALIESTFDIVLEEEMIEAAGNWVEEADVMNTIQQSVAEITGIATPGTNGSTTNQGSSEFGMVLEVLRETTSVEALLSVIGVCVALMALLLLTHWGRPFAAMRTAGIPIMLAGLVFAAPTAAANTVFSLIPGVAGRLIGTILTMTGYVSVSVFVLGLGMIIAGAILNSHYKKLYLAKLAAKVEVPAEVPAAEEVKEEAPAAEEMPAEEAKEEAPAAE